MKRAMSSATSIDEYIAEFPAPTQKHLQAIRRVVSRAAPAADEKISYGIPTFALRGNLVHFAAYKRHIGFHPGASAIQAFKEELKAFHTSTGTVQFPLDQPPPLPLIERIVEFRIDENLRP